MHRLPVDPRAWNLFAGLCLASGCGSRVIGADTSSSETADTSESPEAPESSEATECDTEADCPYGYNCNDGVCEYIGYHDGHLDHTDYSYGDCYADYECGPLELCDFNYCQSVRSPLACEPPDPVQTLTIPVASLALSFADVDADGAEELVVATQSELQVYDSGSDVPLVSLRGLDSDSIDAMDAAELDATPGEDVVILFADELRQHASDGLGSFAAPSVSPSNWADSVGLLAADFNGVAPADVLIWASSGAGLELDGDTVVPVIIDAVIESATARSIDDPVAGFVLQYGPSLDFYTGVGEAAGYSAMRGQLPYALTSIEQLGDSFDLSSSVLSHTTPWTVIEQWGPATGNLGAYWGVLGRVTAMVGGDFDGDARADVALLVDDTVQVLFGVLTEDSCLAFYPFAGVATNLAVGDHDGDADDEIAIRFEGGNVAVIDAE
jgi:hypothetical protein